MTYGRARLLRGWQLWDKLHFKHVTSRDDSSSLSLSESSQSTRRSLELPPMTNKLATMLGKALGVHSLAVSQPNDARVL